MKHNFINAQLPGLIQKFGTGLVQNMLKQAGVNPPTGSVKNKLKRSDIIITFTADDFEVFNQRHSDIRDVIPVPPANAPYMILKQGALQFMLNILKNQQTLEQNIIINIEKGNNFGLFLPAIFGYAGQESQYEPPVYQNEMKSDIAYVFTWFPKKNMHGIKYNKVTINFNCDIYSGVLSVIPIVPQDPQYGHVMRCIARNDTFPFTAIKEYQTININGNNPQNAKVKYI